jgi:disulfide bond formation protein DsbB
MDSEQLRNYNALACLFICGILIWAQLLQFIYVELPCPLCMLQRVGFIGIAFGFALNAYYQRRSSHYAISILSALLTCAVAMRQILLHIVPNTGVYGSPIFGLHLYVWSFLMSCTALVVIAIFMLKEKQFEDVKRVEKKPIYSLLFLLVMMLALGNSVSTIKICGFKACPDNPVQYLW